MFRDRAIEALLTARSDDLKAVYLHKLVSGKWTGTMNLAEAQAGSDLAMVRSRAEPQSDGSYHELAKVVAPSADIRPLKNSSSLSSWTAVAAPTAGRSRTALLVASNDYTAVLAWLQAKAGGDPGAVRGGQGAPARQGHGCRGAHGLDLQCPSHTQRAYRKEAECFLLWAMMERKKPMSSMTMEDCIAYRDFLADPLPRSRWCAQRNRERWSPLWNFSPSWTAFQTDRGRDFSVIVDGVSN